ncbi:MAG: hypothetical protein AABW85_00675 [archaeon]
MLVFADVQTTTMTWFVPSSKSHSIAYGGTCTSTIFFFPEDQAALDNDADGNAAQILPFNARSGGSACQSSTVAGMTITNTGTVTETIDANFAATLDTNVWLKVWEGTGAGCGTGGLGGWQRFCLAHTGATTTDVNSSGNCRDFNSSDTTGSRRLITSLPAADTNQLCFTGDLLPAIYGQAAKITQGDKNGSFRTSTDVS